MNRAGPCRAIGEVLARSCFERASTAVAPALLGCVIEKETVDGVVAIRLTEVEAYQGEFDPASHAFRGQTARNAVMYGAAGFVYVYFTYGMHFCMNLVCEPPGVPSAVLLRAGELVKGADLVAARRGGAAFRELARGPARLTVALGVSGNDNGRDACDPASPLRIRAGAVPDPDAIRSGPRVGVAAAADVAWRFWLDGEQSVSAYRRHAPRRRPASPSTRAESDTQGFRA